MRVGSTNLLTLNIIIPIVFTIIYLDVSTRHTVSSSLTLQEFAANHFGGVLLTFPLALTVIKTGALGLELHVHSEI